MIANGVLVLNRNWTAIHVTSVQRAITLLVQDLAQVVDDNYRTYDFNSWRELSAYVDTEGNQFIHSPSFRMVIPEVILLTSYHRVPPRAVKFNRRNIYIRDGYKCQYCGRKPPREELTIDHVVPRSRGGRSEWENVVLACQSCNAKKGNRLLQDTPMQLPRAPKKPNWISIVRHTLKAQSRPAWQRYVDMAYWNVDLEE
ncbi:MAG: hypothetical protein PWP23_73 [Candidatus Sumerlaeota bacterium]|nr:hypothetical protein [Candidatus Sumerlaeota bacterium]